MRVLHVNVSLDAVTGGGTAERTFQLTRALTAAGAECTVLTLDVGLDPDRIPALAPARVVALPCASRRFYLPRCAPGGVADLVRRADVVHLTGHWTVLNALAYLAARRQGKPHVVCPAGALPVFGRSGRLKLAYNAAVGRRLVRDAAAHVAITDAERADFAAYGVDPGRVDVIPNGVDPADLDVRAGTVPGSWPGLDGQPFVAFLGRLNRIKGPDLLLDAFVRAGDATGGHHLAFAGPDEGLRAHLQGVARASAVADRVHFLGPLHGPAKAMLYRRAALLAVPSRQEAMSLVAVEAGAAGTPVLLTDACGFDDVVQVGGGAVVPATAAGIEHGLRELLAAPDRLPVMGERLRALVLGAYTWDRMAARYLQVYRTVLEPVS